MDGEASSDSNSCQEIENLDSEPQMHSILTESKEEEEEEEEESDSNEVMDVEESSKGEESSENEEDSASEENEEQIANKENEASSGSEESSESEAINETNESEKNSVSEDNGEDNPTSDGSSSNSNSDSNSNSNSDSNSDSDSDSSGWHNSERSKLIAKMRREKLLALVTEQHKILFDLLRKREEENQNKSKYQFSEVSHDYLMPEVHSPHHYVFSEVMSSPSLEKPYLAKDRGMEIESNPVKVLPHLTEKGEVERKSGKETATLFSSFSDFVGTNEDVAKDVLDVTGVTSGDSTENNDDEICLKESEWHVADSSDSAVFSLGDDLTHQQNSSTSSPVVISSESSSMSASPSISRPNDKEEEQEQEQEQEEEEEQEGKEENIMEEEQEQEENVMEEEKEDTELPYFGSESTENGTVLNSIPPIDITDKVSVELTPGFEELSKQTRMEEEETPVKAVDTKENREIVDIVDTEESQEDEASKESLKIEEDEDSRVVNAAPIANYPESNEVEIIDVSDSSDSSSINSPDKQEQEQEQKQKQEKEKENEKTIVQTSKESPSLDADSFKDSTIDLSAIPEITSIPEPHSIVVPENVIVISPEQPSMSSDPFKSRFSLEQIDAILKPFSTSCEEPSKYQAKREAELRRLRQLPSKLVHRSFVLYCLIL